VRNHLSKWRRLICPKRFRQPVAHDSLRSLLCHLLEMLGGCGGRLALLLAGILIQDVHETHNSSRLRRFSSDKMVDHQHYDGANEGADESCRFARGIDPESVAPYVATSEPMIPSAAVRKKPLGAAPGVSNLAITPTTNPIRMVQMMCTICSVTVSGRYA